MHPVTSRASQTETVGCWHRSPQWEDLVRKGGTDLQKGCRLEAAAWVGWLVYLDPSDVAFKWVHIDTFSGDILRELCPFLSKQFEEPPFHKCASVSKALPQPKHMYLISFCWPMAHHTWEYTTHLGIFEAFTEKSRCHRVTVLYRKVDAAGFGFMDRIWKSQASQSNRFKYIDHWPPWTSA